MIGLMRIKNEARWIERTLTSLFPLCRAVVVFDDHSTDDTAEICRNLPHVLVIPSPFEGLDEVRDKNCLLDQARYTDEWIFMHDGDEALAPGANEIIRAAIANEPDIDCWSLRVRYLWNSEDQERVDGVYGRIHRACIFRPGNHIFQPTNFGGNFHCGNAPQRLQHSAKLLNASLLHLGYLSKEDRIKKYEFYTKNDPDNAFEDNYRHVVIGDLFPAESIFRWAGPLKLEKLT